MSILLFKYSNFLLRHKIELKISIVSISLIAILFSTIFPSVWIVTAKVASGKETIIGLQPGQNTTRVNPFSYNGILNISNNNRTSADPQIDISGKNTYVVWSDDSAGNPDIYFTKSADGGNTFSKPIKLSNNSGLSSNPVLSVSGSNVCVAWHDDTYKSFDIFFAKSADGGNTFSKPIKLTQSANNVIVDSEFPSIASFENNVYLVWQENSTGNFDILLKKSTDGGNTFSDRPINLSNNTGNSAYPKIAVHGNTSYVVWEDNSTGNFDILLKKSTDGGNTFSDKSINLSKNKGNSSDPEVFSDQKSDVFVLWDDDSPGNADIFFTKSADGGNTFGKLINLSNNTNGSFDPVIAASKNIVYVLWDDDSPGNADIFFTKSADGGNTFGKPINLSNNNGTSFYPDLAISGANNTYVIWPDNTLGNYEVFLAKNVR